MVSRSFDVCGITTTDSSNARKDSYKSSMENASKHLQNDEEENDLFFLWFCALISLSSLNRKKEKQILKKYIKQKMKIYNENM